LCPAVLVSVPACSSRRPVALGFRFEEVETPCTRLCTSCPGRDESTIRRAHARMILLIRNNHERGALIAVSAKEARQWLPLAAEVTAVGHAGPLLRKEGVQ
jgi:hypothetical protein